VLPLHRRDTLLLLLLKLRGWGIRQPLHGPMRLPTTHVRLRLLLL
jgi:hypothetical protein